MTQPRDSVLARWRAWRSLRANLRLADAEDYFSTWRWSLKPSEKHRWEKRIERLRRRAERLEAV